MTTTTTALAPATENQSPVRPPRRRCKPASDVCGQPLGPTKRSQSLTIGITTVSAEIKSILKKPSSLTTDDLSPIRARPPITPSASSTPCGGSQKKTKKQVQFDIVSVAAEKPGVDEPPAEIETRTENQDEKPTSVSPLELASHQQQDRPQNPIGMFDDAIVTSLPTTNIILCNVHPGL